MAVLWIFPGVSSSPSHSYDGSSAPASGSREGRAGVQGIVQHVAILVAQGAVDEARQTLDPALQSYPDHSGLQVLDARLNLLENRSRRAFGLFEQLTARPPVALQATVGMLAAAFESQDPARLAHARRKLQAWSQGSADDRALSALECRTFAEMFFAVGRLAPAVFMSEISAAGDSSREAREFLAMAYYQADRLDSSAAVLESLLSSPESRGTAQEMLRQIRAQRQENEMAAKRAQFRNLSTMLLAAQRRGQYERAIDICMEMLSFNRDLFAVERADVERKLAGIRKLRAEEIEKESRTRAFEAMRSGLYGDAIDILRRARPEVGPNLILDGMLSEALLKILPTMDPAAQESALREILMVEDGLETAGLALPSSVLAHAHASLGVSMESRGRWDDAVHHYTAARSRSSTLPHLSGRLLYCRMRASLPRVLWALLALLVAAGMVLLRWPSLYRVMFASYRYRSARLRQDRDAEYRALTALVSLRPGRLDLRRRLAAMADARGDEDVTEYLYRQIRMEESLPPADLLKLFAIYDRRKDDARAYEIAVEVLKSPVEDAVRARMLELKIRHETAMERWGDAFQSARTLLSMKPSAAVAEQAVGLARRTNADVKTIVPLYRAWMGMHPGARDRIVEELESLLAAAWRPRESAPDPVVGDLARLIYQTHVAANRPARAAHILEDLARVEPDPVMSLKKLMDIYTALKDADAVLRTARRLCDAQPSNYAFGMDLASRLKSLDDITGMETVQLDILKHHPNNVELVQMLYEQAKAHFESAGESGAARCIELLRAVIRLTLLDTREMRLLLARCLIQSGQTDESIAVLQGIEGGGYPRLRAQSITADAFLRRDQPHMASDILSKVNFNDPQMTEDLRKEMRYLQAEAFEAEGRMDQAAAVLDELVLIDITYRDVKDRHARLSQWRRRSPAEVVCPSCGKPSPASARFCGSCGSAVHPD